MGRGQTHERATLQPGLYTVIELTPVTFEISARGTPSAGFVFSQVAAYREQRERARTQLGRGSQ